VSLDGCSWVRGRRLSVILTVIGMLWVCCLQAFLFGSLHVFEQAVLQPVTADGKTAAANPTARR